MHSKWTWWLPFLAGIICLAMPFIAPSPQGMSAEAWRVCAVMAIMVIWWLFQVVPLAVTAMIPLVCFPLMQVASIHDTASLYAHPIIFLMLGGFVLGQAITHCNLHQRIVYWVLSCSGKSPRSHVASIMLVTAFLSMWISNTATTIMILPIALGICEVHHNQSAAFKRAMLLGLMCAANVGGMATIIGTPPNALVIGFLSQDFNVHINFIQWMSFGVPIAITLLILIWFWLCFIFCRFDNAADLKFKGLMTQKRLGLGKMSLAERWTVLVFVLAAVAWIVMPFINDALGRKIISDTGIAIIMVFVLFLIPLDLKRRQFLMNWEQANQIPWRILVLFGGGLSLSSQVKSSGLAAWLADQLSFIMHYPLPWQIAVVVLVIMLLTEVNSNMATIAAFAPLLAILATKINLPVETLLIPGALAASCAFMFPIATAPNAIVFGANQFSMKQMFASGVVVNIVAWIVISFLSSGMILSIL